MIKCGIIGLGRIGSTLEDDSKREKPASHAGVIDNHPECIIACGCDVDSTKNRDFGKRWGCTKLYTEYNEMLHKENIDILHIATPPETHLDILYNALQAKIDVIILEKPVADTIEKSKACLKLQHEFPASRIIINHERRYSLQYKRVKELIESSLYGSLLSLKSTLYMGRNRLLRNMLYDDGTHMVDLIHFLTGDTLQLKSREWSSDRRQLLTLACCGNTQIVFEAGIGREYLQFELDVSFEKGRVVVGNGYYREYKSQKSPFYDNFYSLSLNDIIFKKSEYFLQMFKEAVKLYKNSGLTPASTVKDGVMALEFIERILN